ncbi:MAG: hypothetical protein K5858_05600 [Lachnospiraceae bacterium]|nr:hypothetical protein [Lachnospiraceae bacterium]
MITNEKLRLMTRMTIFEESEEGKEAIRIGHYFKHDYIRWELIKTIISVTIAYVLILGMVVLYKLEYLIANALVLNYRGILMKVLGIYLVLIVIYVSGAVIGYSYKYNRERRNLGRYEKSLKRLSGIYKKEETK